MECSASASAIYVPFSSNASVKNAVMMAATGPQERFGSSFLSKCAAQSASAIPAISGWDYSCPKLARKLRNQSQNAMRSTYIVSYDIADDKRLKKVFKAMRDFGDHLQYSVFECQFTPADLARCRDALSEIIHHEQDQVLFILLGPTEGRGERVITALGKAYVNVDAPCIVV